MKSLIGHIFNTSKWQGIISSFPRPPPLHPNFHIINQVNK
jgi:hypothetical protein